MKKILFAAIVLVFGAVAAACTTTMPPFSFTDTFNVSSAHFREIRRGPWEIIENTNFRLILDHDEEIIHVRGRGSNDMIDLKDNIDIRARKPAEEWFPGAEGKIKIHFGYLRRYEAVRSVLLDAGYEYPDYAIRVSGFSLGAAWPQLFLLDAILHWPERDIKAILYAPANPWRKLPKKYRGELKQRTAFVRSYWDAVTCMHLIGFSRYGHNITIGKWWRILPPQHYPPQMTRSLEEKFGDEPRDY